MGLADQPRLLHPGVLGCFSRDLFGLRGALNLRLRGIADSLCQHLVQFSLGLLRFARFLPLGHGRYMGMPEGKVNPGSCRRAQVAKQSSHGCRSNLET